MRSHQKTGVGVAGADRLEAEAAVLDAVRHPGVVELAAFSRHDDVAELDTVHIEGLSLDLGGPLPPEEVAGVAAAVAATLADLHAAGIVHGAIEASHVIVGDGAPVLCGFGRAGTAEPGRQPEDDVVALAELVLDLVDEGPVAAVARRLLDAPTSAADAASAFRAAVHEATLPGGAPGRAEAPRLGELLRPAGRRRIRRRLLIPLATAAVLAVGVAFGLARGGSASSTEAIAPVGSAAPVRSTTTTTMAPAPTPTQVWPQGPAPTIVLAEQHFAVGEPGDVAIAGPWGCGGTGPVAAVVRPSTGEVYVFREAAATGRDVDGERVATVVGATRPVVEDLDGDGCTDLAIERGDAPPVTVPTEAAS